MVPGFSVVLVVQEMLPLFRLYAGMDVCISPRIPEWKSSNRIQCSNNPYITQNMTNQTLIPCQTKINQLAERYFNPTYTCNSILNTVIIKRITYFILFFSSCAIYAGGKSSCPLPAYPYCDCGGCSHAGCGDCPRDLL